MNRPYRLEEAARQLGVSRSFLREQDGRKLPLARRDINNWRIYTEDDLSKLRELLAPGAAPEKAQP